MRTVTGKIRMPAEWEPHARCWMAWPYRRDLWVHPIEAVQKDYAAVAHAIRCFEPVTMIVDPTAVVAARDHLGADIDLMDMPIEDSWLRDSGPSFVKTATGAKAGVCWRFNAWGGKTAEFSRDARVGPQIVERVRAEPVHSALAFEGGGLSVDGEGTMLTTETCVLNANRNPGISKEKVEAEFARTLGVEKVIWLTGDPYETGTNGHVDGIACFARTGVVLFEESAYSEGKYFDVTKRNRAALMGQTDAAGRPIELIFLTEAERRNAEATANFSYSTSYINFYIANGGIVMPAFSLASDGAAREAVRAAFPDRDVIQVDISVLASGGGGIHCITQQEPAWLPPGPPAPCR